ncbi:snRNA-activating protein complex subunit 4-like isoform X1 [Myxocyprinus asiaticus]|uniref:snRNA-activating protein complex subunit 4-like isoform X1 n=2 Tax=Myxocyprinus asiaticus TaxID=70543 RepID=UPI00222392E9|nr:snRNA-activating protein complex subunit 4-like isoform X1 [Myxocyprinus asiaticus]XP_051547393.1 snRNA-activating protein complex subunit 4-like isoform X1 [Myxocyprinus asiaticus]
MASNDLVAEREKIQRQILALENTLGVDSSIAELLSSDSNSDDDDSGPTVDGVPSGDLEAERQRIQREIEDLENTLGTNAALVDILTESEHGSGSSDEDSDDDELDLPQNVETCLQMNLVYQEVLKEKLAELERLLNDNQQEQKQIEAQLSGPTTSNSTNPTLPPQKHFLGYFMKPYFKDKLTGLGPPANEETKERLSHGTRLFDELKIKRWEGWQKALLINGVITDTMKRMLQPKLSKLDYLSAKMSKATDEEKKEMKKQVELIEKDISEISAMKEDQLMGELHDDHDWEKISNIDFEGLRQAEDLKRFWQNYLHPSINKSVWKKDEIDKLSKVAQEYKCCHWDKIAEALGTNRTAFMCFQTYQRYISKTFKRKGWTKEEDEILKDLIKKMKIGNFIPYMQMSYFMVGRDASQLAYRWNSVLDPSIKKGPWSKEEDELLRKAVAKYGITEWWKIKAEVPGRTDGACRDRYLDCLRENVKKGPWTKEEIELLKQKVEKYGVGKWSKIASEIPNRLDCQCLYKWRKLTQFRKGTKRVQKNVPVQQKAKRRKLMRKNIKEEIEITSGSEEEEQMKIEYMDSDAEPSLGDEPDEPDVPPDKDLSPEIQPKDYVQPDMKEWIPVNARPMVRDAGTVRTVWVSLPTNEDEQKKSTKESTLGRIRSENSVCPPMRPCLVRNTILNRFGNMERTYVGLDPIVLQRPADDENSMIKVPISDIRHFLQRKETSAMKKEKRKTPGDKKKRRQVQDWSSLNNDLLKAISPWIGNVILPVPANEKKFCEADIVGGRAANITLTKTAVFSFFVKTLHMDTEGCKNVIKVCKKKGPKMQNAEHIPKKAPPNTVSAMLQESKLRKAEQKEPAGPPQPPTPLQPVHVLNHAQQPVWQMTPTLVQPNTLVITQPNMQGAVQPLLLNVLPRTPPQIPTLIQLTAPVQPTSTFSPTSKSPSTESIKIVRKTRRPRKPTEKFQALMEQTKTNVCKKDKGKQSVVVPTSAVQRQIKWILTPTGFVPVTGMLSANIPDNQTLNMPNTSLLNYTTLRCISTSPNPSSSALVLPASSCISASNASRDPPMPPPSINITSTGNGLAIQIPPNTLVQNQSMPNTTPQMSSQAPIIVDQKGSFAHTEASQPRVSIENSSESVLDLSVSSSKETTARLNLSYCPPMGPSVSSAVTNVLSVLPSPTVLSKPTLVSGPVVCKPTDKVTVAKPQGVAKNACVPITAIQQPTIIQNQGLPITIVQPNFPHSSNTTLLQPLSSSSTVVVPSKVPQITKPSQQLIPNPVLPSKSLSFDPNLVFPDHSTEVDDWMNGKGGIPLPHLEVTLPYLPPSVASIKTLTSLLKVKQSLIANAAKILPQEYQTEKEEEAQVSAIRKLVAERFATNPAYQLCKARFLSCFTLPALLATINPYEECELPDEDEAEEMHLQKNGENDQPPAARAELNTNENEASAAQFSGISTKKQRRRRPVK